MFFFNIESIIEKKLKNSKTVERIVNSLVDKRLKELEELDSYKKPAVLKAVMDKSDKKSKIYNQLKTEIGPYFRDLSNFTFQISYDYKTEYVGTTTLGVNFKDAGELLSFCENPKFWTKDVLNYSGISLTVHADLDSERVRKYVPFISYSNVSKSDLLEVLKIIKTFVEEYPEITI